MSVKKWFIGRFKDGYGPCYLEDFKWDCGWYWAGGYVGNGRIHTHVDSLGSDLNGGNANMYDKIKHELKDIVMTDKELWRFCDLFAQFYAFKKAAECFQHGGHYTSWGRTEAEINKEQGAVINKHIETVIIPEVRKLMAPYEVNR